MVTDTKIAKQMFISIVHKVTEEEFGLTTDHLMDLDSLTEGLLIAKRIPADAYTLWCLTTRGCIATLKAALPAVGDNVKDLVYEEVAAFLTTPDFFCEDCCGECKCFDEFDNEEEPEEQPKEEQPADKNIGAVMHFAVTPDDFMFNADVASDERLPEDVAAFFNSVVSAVKNEITARTKKVAKQEVKPAAKKAPSKKK